MVRVKEEGEGGKEATTTPGAVYQSGVTSPASRACLRVCLCAIVDWLDTKSILLCVDVWG